MDSTHERSSVGDVHGLHRRFKDDTYQIRQERHSTTRRVCQSCPSSQKDLEGSQNAWQWRCYHFSQKWQRYADRSITNLIYAMATYTGHNPLSTEKALQIEGHFVGYTGYPILDTNSDSLWQSRHTLAYAAHHAHAILLERDVHVPGSQHLRVHAAFGSVGAAHSSDARTAGRPVARRRNLVL